MARKNLIRTSEFYYHITTRSNHKYWFQLPMSQVWQISIKAFQNAQSHYPANVAQFVLMGNHYHMLVQTPDENIDKFMYRFNKHFSDLLRRKTNTINRMFGSNYKWSLIGNQEYFYNVFRYIYQNPIRAGLVKFCQNYPFSTLYFSFRDQKVPFPFSPLEELERDLDFINGEFKNNQVIAIKKGLRKSIYSETSGKPR